MGYFDNFNNESLNKYKKILKMIFFINMFFYLWIDGHSSFMQFHYHLTVHQIPSNFYVICNGFNLAIFDGQSNDNKIE
jgi:hypothetical protein